MTQSSNPLLKPVTLFLSSKKQSPTAVSEAGTGPTSFSIEPPGIALTDIGSFFSQVMGDGNIAGAMPGQLDSSHIMLTNLSLYSGKDDAGDSYYGGELGLAWQNADWQLVPGFLTLSDPAIGIDVLYTKGASGSSTHVTGSLTSFIELAGLGLVITLDVPSFRAKAEMPEGETYSIATLLSKLGLSAKHFKSITLKDAMLLVDVKGKAYVTHFELQNIQLLECFTIVDVKVDLSYRGGVPSQLNTNLYSQLQIGNLVTLDLNAVKEDASPGWQLNGSADIDATLANMADGMGDLVGLSSLSGSLPHVLSELSITRVNLGYNTGSKNLNFGGALVFDGFVDATLNLDAKLTARAGSGYDKNFAGQLLLNEKFEFDLAFQQTLAAGATTSSFVGSFENSGGEAVSVADMLSNLDASLGSLASGLNFKIKAAMLAYQSQILSTAQKAAKDTPKKDFFVTADIDFGLDLSGLGDLPLIGSMLPTDQALAISFQPLFAKLTIESTLASSTLTDLAPNSTLHLPETINNGFDLITTLKMGGETKHLDLGVGDSVSSSEKPVPADINSIGTPKTSSTPPTTPPGASVANTSVAQVKWINIQKHFGPIHFNRIGIGFDKSKKTISALLDAGLALGPLNVDLMGLGAHYEMDDQSLSFSLNGLGLDFKRPPMELGGAFLRMDPDFVGKATLKMETFALSALGMYGKHEGHPSLFLYAFLDYPLGGPSFFFVEGVAVAFGLNRRLIVPPVDQIHNFPLITEVIGESKPPKSLTGTGSQIDVQTGVSAELNKLEQYIPFENGRILIGAGLRFTTFEIIDSFALLVVQLGHGLEIEVMGVSTATVPPSVGQSSTDRQFLAEAQLEFKAWFNLLEGTLGAQANLTPNSYVFSKDCVVTGGFAFGMWMLGEHAGDFVYTYGGYHPHYNVPSHYPTVNRLGFNWKFPEAPITIKGELYFALTGRALMAGGRLAAVWESGDIKAWFDIYANVLIVWKPFHYEANIGIEIGAQVTIHFFGTHHITVHLGADLSIWGPEFGGTAEVDLWITSVTIDFGAAVAPPPALSWNEFSNNFLPKPNAGKQSVVTVSINGGLIQSNKETTGERWLVNAKELRLTSKSQFPCQADDYVAYVDMNEASSTDIWASKGVGFQNCDFANKTGFDALATDDSLQAFGIDPMRVPSNEIKSTQLIRVFRDEADNVSNDFIFVPQVQKVPTGLWNTNAGMSDVNINDSTYVNAITGYAVIPAKPPKPHKTFYVEDGQLLYEVIPRNVATVDTDTVTYTIDGSKEFDTVYSSKGVVKARDTLLGDLGFDVTTDIDLSKDLPDAFVQTPIVVTSIVTAV